MMSLREQSITVWIIAVLSICNGYDVYYTENVLLFKFKSVINCPENDICNIHVTGAWALQKSTIKCPSNRDCYIHCYAKGACYQSVINCPATANCVIKCFYAQSCAYFTVNTQSSGSSSGNLLNIECAAIWSCYKSNIDTLNNVGGALNISAPGNHFSHSLLYQSLIKCPKNGQCLLSVTGSYSMEYSVVDASLSTSLDLKVGGSTAMAYSSVWCPNDGMENTKQNCNIEIDSYQSYTMYQTKIYAVESFKDLHLKCIGSYCTERNVADGGKNAPKLYCKTKYNANCALILTDKEWACSTASDCSSWTLEQGNSGHGHGYNVYPIFLSIMAITVIMIGYILRKYVFKRQNVSNDSVMIEGRTGTAYIDR